METGSGVRERTETFRREEHDENAAERERDAGERAELAGGDRGVERASGGGAVGGGETAVGAAPATIDGQAVAGSGGSTAAPNYRAVAAPPRHRGDDREATATKRLQVLGRGGRLMGRSGASASASPPASDSESSLPARTATADTTGAGSSPPSSVPKTAPTGAAAKPLRGGPAASDAIVAPARPPAPAGRRQQLERLGDFPALVRPSAISGSTTAPSEAASQRPRPSSAGERHDSASSASSAAQPLVVHQRRTGAMGLSDWTEDPDEEMNFDMPLDVGELLLEPTKPTSSAASAAGDEKTHHDTARAKDEVEWTDIQDDSAGGEEAALAARPADAEQVAGGPAATTSAPVEDPLQRVARELRFLEEQKDIMKRKAEERARQRREEEERLEQEQKERAMRKLQELEERLAAKRTAETEQQQQQARGGANGAIEASAADNTRGMGRYTAANAGRGRASRTAHVAHLSDTREAFGSRDRHARGDLSRGGKRETGVPPAAERDPSATRPGTFEERDPRTTSRRRDSTGAPPRRGAASASSGAIAPASAAESSRGNASNAPGSAAARERRRGDPPRIVNKGPFLWRVQNSMRPAAPGASGDGDDDRDAAPGTALSPRWQARAMERPSFEDISRAFAASSSGTTAGASLRGFGSSFPLSDVTTEAAEGDSAATHADVSASRSALSVGSLSESATAAPALRTDPDTTAEADAAVSVPARPHVHSDLRTDAPEFVPSTFFVGDNGQFLPYVSEYGYMEVREAASTEAGRTAGSKSVHAPPPPPPQVASPTRQRRGEREAEDEDDEDLAAAAVSSALGERRATRGGRGGKPRTDRHPHPRPNGKAEASRGRGQEETVQKAAGESKAAARDAKLRKPAPRHKKRAAAPAAEQPKIEALTEQLASATLGDTPASAAEGAQQNPSAHGAADASHGGSNNRSAYRKPSHVAAAGGRAAPPSKRDKAGTRGKSTKGTTETTMAGTAAEAPDSEAAAAAPAKDKPRRNRGRGHPARPQQQRPATAKAPAEEASQSELPPGKRGDGGGVASAAPTAGGADRGDDSVAPTASTDPASTTATHAHKPRWHPRRPPPRRARGGRGGQRDAAAPEETKGEKAAAAPTEPS